MLCCEKRSATSTRLSRRRSIRYSETFLFFVRIIAVGQDRTHDGIEGSFDLEQYTAAIESAPLAKRKAKGDLTAHCPCQPTCSATAAQCAISPIKLNRQVITLAASVRMISTRRPTPRPPPRSSARFLPASAARIAALIFDFCDHDHPVSAVWVDLSSVITEPQMA
jgi:hypothetical protein